MEEEADSSSSQLKLLETTLRIFAPLLSVAALLLVVTIDDHARLKFSHLSGLTYAVWGNAIAASSVIILFCGSALRRRTALWIAFVVDQIASYLLIGSGSAVAEIVFLAYNGDRQLSWSAACGSYGAFCRRALASLVIHFLASVCFVALSLISAFRLFSLFELPASSKEGP